MEAIAVTKTEEKKKGAHAASDSLAEPMVAREVEVGAKAGMPLFLQRAVNSSSQFVQRQKEKEKKVEEEETESTIESELLIQPKLTVGAPDDEYERQADQVAEQVMLTPVSKVAHPFEEERQVPQQSSIVQIKPITPLPIQRLCTKCEEESQENNLATTTIPIVQRKANGEFSLSSSHYVAKTIQSPTGGSLLPQHTQSRIGNVLSWDLSHIRVHNDSVANEAAESINAKAFTHKNHIYLGKDQNANDFQLMAHEVTHSVQQSNISNRIQQVKQTRVNPGNENSKLSNLGQISYGGPDLKSSLSSFQSTLQNQSNTSEFLNLAEMTPKHGARISALSASGGVPVPTDLRSNNTNNQDIYFNTQIYSDVKANFANVLLGTRSFAMDGNIYLGPGHTPNDSYVKEVVLPHELIHVQQQQANSSINVDYNQAEREADYLASQVGRNQEIKPLYRANENEPQGIIWWVVGGVAAIWLLSGESIANAPGYQRDRRGRFIRDERGRRISEQTIPSPSTGEYITEASTSTILFVTAGPAGSGVRSLLGRSLFRSSTGLAARLIPHSAGGFTTFSMLDVSLQTASGRAPWDPEYSPRQTLTFGAIGAATAPWVAGSAYYLLRGTAEAGPSLGQLVVYYSTSATGSGLIGAGMMQTLRPEHRASEFALDFALFGVGGGLWARSMPHTLVVTDPNAFVMVDTAGEFGRVGTAYVVQESESGLFTVSRVGNYSSVVEGVPSQAAPRGLTASGASDIIVDRASGSFATLDVPFASSTGIQLGRQPLYLFTESGDILLVENVAVSPTTGYLSVGGAEGAAGFRTFFPSPSLTSQAAWWEVTQALDQIYANPASLPNLGNRSVQQVQEAIRGSGGRTMSVTVIESEGQITVNVGISGRNNPVMNDVVLPELRQQLPGYNFAPVEHELPTQGFTFRNPPSIISQTGQIETMARPQGTCAEVSVASQGLAQSMSTGWWSPTGRAVPMRFVLRQGEPWMLPCESCRANSDIMYPPETIRHLRPGSPQTPNIAPIFIIRDSSETSPEEEQVCRMPEEPIFTAYSQ